MISSILNRAKIGHHTVFVPFDLQSVADSNCGCFQNEVEGLLKKQLWSYMNLNVHVYCYISKEDLCFCYGLRTY